MDEKMNELKNNINVDKICAYALAALLVIISIGNLGIFFIDKKHDVMDLRRGIYSLFSVVIMMILISIFEEIGRGSSPFTMKTVHKLQIMSAMIIVAALVPNIVTKEIVEHFYGMENEVALQVQSYTSDYKMFLITLAIIMGIISEIFKYGVKLQEDNDSIA